ncbi:NAD(P)/FAD-dependent oxidoreductase [Candidatus Desantisbacteria bacterium]|nr:NAD(P)/FAD-dependent oxidoreductase [Candidatus Desantisbacteria bacterium]
MKQIVILGAGAGGTMSANHLRRKLSPQEWNITVIDRSSLHYYQPGFLFLPFRFKGYQELSDVSKPTRKLIDNGVDVVNAEITEIDTKNNVVKTKAGNFHYDWLVSSLGCRIIPDQIDGMKEGYEKNVFDFYTPDGAIKLQRALDRFDGGKLVFNIAEMPIKCPVAPIEFVFLADYYFHTKGIRNKVEITLVTPLAGAFTKPIASKVFGEIAKNKGINIVPDFGLGYVDHVKKTIKSHTKQELDYDLLVAIPPTEGAEVIEDSGLGNGAGWIRTDKQTLKAIGHNNIYSIGDGTDLPTSKAGSVAHFESEVMSENLLSEIRGKEPKAKFDGHSNCFIESGFNKALLIDFNYKVEPVPGKFPLPIIGPFSLLKETKVNHQGKLAFRWAYWNQILTCKLPGEPIMTNYCSPNGKKVSMLKDGKAAFEV